jgi:lysyl endopeptidase
MNAQKADSAMEPGRQRVGVARDLQAPVRLPQWIAVAGGYVTRFRVSSENATGLRVKLDLGSLPDSLEARVQGSDHVIERMDIDASNGPAAWTPWTEGSMQTIELFSRAAPSSGTLTVASVVHFTENPATLKAAAACTVSTQCPAGSDALDVAIGERKKSVMRINFVEDGHAFICTATLINTDKFPAGYLLTANHCINTVAAAGTVTTLWFYENADCDVSAAGILDGRTQVAGGAQLVFSNHNVDSTLLLMNRAPPARAVYAGWNTDALAGGTSIVSISNPDGDTLRYALGSVTREYLVDDYPQEHVGVHFSRGIIEGGSSGSGLFTLSNGGLQLRAILTGTTLRAGGLACDNTTVEEGLYGRFEIFGPQIAPFIRTNPPAADDAPNRFSDVTTDVSATPLDQRGSTLVVSGKRIDYAGDVDVYRFTLSRETSVTVASDGGLDVVGSILDPNGVEVAMNDDIDPGIQQNFSITKTLQAGTYYVQVVAFAPDGTGAYGLRFSAGVSTTPGFDFSSVNYTDLWWNSAESGWGLNLNHQGDIVFGTLFTYDAAGPMWLVLANGAKQSDGSYQGALFRTTGPAFNASPWTPTTATQVGTMRLVFAGVGTATLTYTVNGTSVTKSITRQGFGPPTTCTWTTNDRSFATNYQDLWWNPAESGWGVNITHQGNTLFATLFTYDASGKGIWLVASAPLTGTATYSGSLSRTTGPVFNASPWTGIQATPVGTMTFSFASGNSGTMTYTVDGVSVTKSIQRQTFGTPLPLCTSG